MGRPLNKKYFGNRNTGSASTTGDDYGIGGGFLASISNGTVGAIQINDTHRTFPSLTVAAPTLPGGVTATTSTVWEIAAIVISDDGSGYTINQTGAAVTTVTGLYGYASVAPVLTINTDGSGNVSAINITSRGEFTSINGTGITTWAVVGAGGTNAQITVTFRVKSISVTEPGSGYASTPSLSWSQVNGGTMPSAQSVTMGTDTGNVGATTNQENAILMTARLVGGSAVTVDIIKQVSTDRFKVTDGTRTGIVKLKSSVATAAGEASVRLLDSDNGTYFATKITSRKATITRGTGVQAAFVTGTAVQWNMTAATATSLLIDNA